MNGFEVGDIWPYRIEFVGGHNTQALLVDEHGTVVDACEPGYPIR